MTQTVRLDEMIDQDSLFNSYPWLSTHTVSRWRSTGQIRFFAGTKGKFVYPRSDIELALSKEMACQNEEGSLNTAGNGSAKRADEMHSTDIGTTSEPARLSEERSKRRISGKQKKN